jgi:protein tyrosine phosphatase
MDWRVDISEIADVNNPSPSISYWNTLLNYFERNKDILPLDALILLANESERCRKYWNTDHHETKTVEKNGKMMEVTVTREGLGIEAHNVNPNIHEFIEQKIKNNRIERPSEMPSFEENLIPIAS